MVKIKKLNYWRSGETNRSFDSFESRGSLWIKQREEWGEMLFLRRPDWGLVTTQAEGARNKSEDNVYL